MPTPDDMSHAEMPDELVVLRSLRGARLVDALEDYLRGANSESESPLGEARPVDGLISYILSVGLDRPFERRLRRAAGELLRTWRLGMDSYQLLVDLVALSALLLPKDLRPVLTRLLVGGEGRGIDVVPIGVAIGNIDLHYHLLRGLVGQPVPAAVVGVLKNDIYDPRYSVIAYLLLSQQAVSNLERFFLPLLSIAAENPQMVDLPSVLTSVVLSRMAIERFYGLLRGIAPIIALRQQAALEEALLRIGWSVSLLQNRYWVLCAPGQHPVAVRLQKHPRGKLAMERVTKLSIEVLKDYDPDEVRQEILAAAVAVAPVM